MLSQLLPSTFLFFKKNPALLIALFFLSGVAFAIKPAPIFLLPAIISCLPWIKKTFRLLLFCIIFFLAFFLGKASNERFPENTQIFHGTAIFSLTEIKSEKNHFKKSNTMKGLITSMHGDNGEVAKNIPCIIPLPQSLRPLQYNKYLIKGSLEKKQERYIFKPDLKEYWVGKDSPLCLAECRFQAKNFLAKALQKVYSNAKVSDFLIALTLGDLNDPLLRFSFGRLGLQHILAISGFHFGILALFLGFFFRLLLKEKAALIGLMITLSLYFFLIENSPSILRAYLAILLYLIGRLGKWQTRSLNILGTVLLIELLLDPQSLKSLGFQLSFLATSSILLLYPLTYFWMSQFFPRRSVNEALKLNSLAKWSYLFCCFLRSTTALNFAVCLTIIPVCLFYFGKFPLISLLYNLFVPLSVSLSMSLLLLSIPFFFLMPPLATFLTFINETFTNKMLNILTEAPNRLDFHLSLPTFSLTALVSLLFIIFSLPFLFSKKTSESFQ